jgi:hypothetical protein
MGTSASAERREANRQRFDGTVELSLPDDPESYEADAIDLSIGGMSLKTAYLPDVGSELDCRIRLDATDTRTVQARGRVVWAREGQDEHGSFGLRFTEIARGDLAAIGKLCERDGARDAKPQALLRLPRLPDPVSASVEKKSDGAMVLGMGLSFIKFGETVEVEQDGERVRGAIERVEVMVDPVTNVPRLMATLALEGATPRAATPARKARTSDRPAPARDASSERPSEKAASPATRERAPDRTPGADLESKKAAPPAPAHGTEVLSSSEGAERADKAASDAKKTSAPSELSDDGSTPSLASDSTTPAWLVSALAKVRAGGRSVAEHAGPAVKRAFATLVTLMVALSTRVRAKVTGKPVELPAATPAAGAKTTAKSPTAPGKPALRPQHAAAAEPAAVSTATDSTTPATRRKYALVGLGVFGLSAITFAVATGGRERRVEPPRPQVAVESAAAPTAAGATTPTTAAATEAPAAQTATSGTTEPEPAAPEAEATTPAPSRPAGAPAVARMPSDLVAAARSRNANVEAERPTIRRDVTASPIAPRAVTTGRPAVTPAAAPAVASAVRPLGSPAVRTGTVLRLRFDGPITSLTGGVAGRDGLAFRVDGRRVLDRAASFVRMDSRIAGAGAYNRGTGAEFTLRFQGAPPAFSARARGDVLEVVLAAPAAGGLRVAAAARPTAPVSRVASMPRR